MRSLNRTCADAIANTCSNADASIGQVRRQEMLARFPPLVVLRHEVPESAQSARRSLQHVFGSVLWCWLLVCFRVQRRGDGYTINPRAWQRRATTKMTNDGQAKMHNNNDNNNAGNGLRPLAMRVMFHIAARPFGTAFRAFRHPVPCSRFPRIITSQDGGERTRRTSPDMWTSCTYPRGPPRGSPPPAGRGGRRRASNARNVCSRAHARDARKLDTLSWPPASATQESRRTPFGGALLLARVDMRGGAAIRSVPSGAQKTDHSGPGRTASKPGRCPANPRRGVLSCRRTPSKVPGPQGRMAAIRERRRSWGKAFSRPPATPKLAKCDL